MRKIILYIATSLDGFIADKEGGVDWLPHPSDDDMGYNSLMARVKTVFMGSRSYEQILGFGDWAWPDKTTYVFTSKSLVTDRNDIHFVHDNISQFIESPAVQVIKQDIWLLGGAELVKSFAKLKLIDECIITIIPTYLVEGIKLELPYEDFKLDKTKKYSEGIYQKIYLKEI